MRWGLWKFLIIVGVCCLWLERSNVASATPPASNLSEFAYPKVYPASVGNPKDTSPFHRAEHPKPFVLLVNVAHMVVRDVIQQNVGGQARKSFLGKHIKPRISSFTICVPVTISPVVGYAGGNITNLCPKSQTCRGSTTCISSDKFNADTFNVNLNHSASNLNVSTKLCICGSLASGVAFISRPQSVFTDLSLLRHFIEATPNKENTSESQGYRYKSRYTYSDGPYGHLPLGVKIGLSLLLIVCGLFSIGYALWSGSKIQSQAAITYIAVGFGLYLSGVLIAVIPVF